MSSRVFVALRVVSLQAEIAAVPGTGGERGGHRIKFTGRWWVCDVLRDYNESAELLIRENS